MNKLSLLAFCGILVGAVQAQEVSWPKAPVVGVVGGSFGSCQAPIDSPLLGAGLAGCSYESLDVALLRNQRLERHGFTVQSTAQGGARSYDVAGTGWLGYAGQYQQLYARTTWPLDGINRLKYVVVSLPNDCLHSIPCSEQDIDNMLLHNIVALADNAATQNVKLIVNAYPAWEDLNLSLTAEQYGLVNMMEEDDYNYLKARHKQVLSAHPNIIYLDVWRHNFDPIDGLHPSKANMRKAAKRITQAILRDAQ